MMSDPTLVRSYGDTDFITGLRAIAATMVVVIHTAALRDFGPVGEAITNAGKYGVDVFFVISGFTVAKTFKEAPCYSAYLTRRLFRIAPIYWIVVSLALLFSALGWTISPWMEDLGASPNFYNLFMHLSMLSFLDYRIASSAIGVEWTIPIEVFWYTLLPLLIAYTRTVPRTFLVVLALAIFTAGLSYFLKKSIGTSLPAKWLPTSHGHFFFVGALTYVLRQKFTTLPLQKSRLWIAGAVVIFFVSLAVSFPGRGELIALSTAVLVTFLAPGRGKLVFKALTLKPLLFVGSISYSLYLVHYAVISGIQKLGVDWPNAFVGFLVVFLVSVAISTVTYVVIERPTNAWGRRIVQRRWGGNVT